MNCVIIASYNGLSDSRLIGAKALPKPMLNDFNWTPKASFFIKRSIECKFKNVPERKNTLEHVVCDMSTIFPGLCLLIHIAEIACRAFIVRNCCIIKHDDVIKWKHFPRNWPFVREIHRSPVNFPHKGQWRGALMFSLIYAWINDWVNNREAGDLRRQNGHYDIIVMNDNNSIPHPLCQANVMIILPLCLP